jgi:AAA domain/DnaB-like helicase N terminal domain
VIVTEAPAAAVDVFEQTMLGGMLNGAVADVLRAGVQARHLADDGHRLVFGAAAALHAAGQPVDCMTVFARLHEQGRAAPAGGIEYINKLALSVAAPSEALTAAKAVLRDSARRELQAIGNAAVAGGDLEALAARARGVLDGAGDQQRAQGTPFKLLSVADLRAMPPQRWLIHSVLPRQGVAAIFGASGSGKGFFVVHIVAAVGDGDDCFGHRSRQGRVVYIVLEGQHGIPQRINAWERDTGREFPDAVRFVFDPFNLNDRDDIIGMAAAVAAAGGADLIVIDTLNRAAPGFDENSSVDMGKAVEAVTQLQAMTGGLVLLLHHSGKDATKGMRGHSSLHANLDAVIEVSRTGDRREWKSYKQKDGKDGEAHPFKLRVVHLGEDEDGEPITSCVIDADSSSDDGGDRTSVRLPKGGNQRIVYDGLSPLFRASRHTGQAGAPLQRPCLTLDDAIAGTRDRLAVEQKRRSERARQAITGLIASGVLGSNEGWLWLR